MHETTVLLIQVGALLFGLGLLGRLAGRIGISPIPLYLLAGLAFGHGGILELSESEAFFEVGAEIGVILLLVMLGLEYAPEELVGNLKQGAPAGLVDALANAVPGLVFGLLLGWSPIAAVALGGVTWISSSGVIAKLLNDLGRVGNRETPVITSILVMEDLAMAFYLPVLSALVIGAGLVAGATTLAVAIVAVLAVLVLALRFGRVVAALVTAKTAESVLLGVFGLTLLVAGVAESLNVSAAVGAFLVGIAISGPVAEHATELLMPLRDLFAAVFFVFFGLATDPRDMPPVLIPAALLAIATMATKMISGWYAARRAGIAVPGRLRAGFGLMPRGEFSIVIAGLAVGAGIEPQLAPLATAYVLITVVTGPLLARLSDSPRFKTWLRSRTGPPRGTVERGAPAAAESGGHG